MSSGSRFARSTRTQQVVSCSAADDHELLPLLHPLVGHCQVLRLYRCHAIGRQRRQIRALHLQRDGRPRLVLRSSSQPAALEERLREVEDRGVRLAG